jgi:CRISPR-associated protein Cas2
MTAPIRHVLLCYDVACNRRRRRVASIAEDHGVRLQQSVFEVRLTPSRIRRMLALLHEACNANEDSVICIPMCAACLAGRGAFGTGSPQPVPALLVA